ncbi:hypothetical protein F2Q68_00041120 [Brassica cretica]|uniref:Pentacotripeptide-repeat region of PRORP domain-containing protein n=1 Tax=Brassica cretica TaxID=69181 RepID=A0A8S9MTJ4_BRACR|nr:hypothetical protein F2Q68_00041120 [Brassica cretica]
MYKSKAVLSSLRNAYSKTSNRSYLSRVQVGFSSSINSPWQFRSFSSKPESMLQLILENDWSKEVVEGLRKPDMPLTHETAIYVLRKLAKHPEKAYSFLDWVIRESDLTPSSPLYSTMLRMILVQQRPMERFRTTLTDMKQGGFCLDEETYKTIYTLLNRESYKDAKALARFYNDNAMYVVADNVSASVSKLDWGCEVERQLQDIVAMYKSKAVLSSLRNAYSKTSNRFYLSRVQVGFSSSINSPWQFRSFSSKPESMLQLVLESDWSKEVVEGLRKPDTPLTHETAIYVLRKLAKHPEKAYSFLEWVIRESDLTPSSPLYSTMLRMILVQQRPMERFRTTLTDMKQGGFCLDEETYKTIYTLLNRESYKDAKALARFYNDNAMYVVADNVSASVSKLDWGCEVERQLQGMKLPLSDHNFVIRVLNGLKEHPLKAFSFLRWVGGCYKHSTVTYNAALRVLIMIEPRRNKIIRCNPYLFSFFC